MQASFNDGLIAWGNYVHGLHDELKNWMPPNHLWLVSPLIRRGGPGRNGRLYVALRMWLWGGPAKWNNPLAQSWDNHISLFYINSHVALALHDVVVDTIRRIIETELAAGCFNWPGSPKNAFLIQRNFARPELTEDGRVYIHPVHDDHFSF